MMETGLTYTSTVVVSKENVAATMGSGDLNVFATPAMVAVSYTHLAIPITEIRTNVMHGSILIFIYILQVAYNDCIHPSAVKG